MAKTYTTVPDKASGDLFTEAMWDTHIKQNVNNLMSPALARAVRSTSQSVPSASTAAIQFNATDTFDSDGLHDPSSNNTKLIIQTPGVYLLTANVTWASIGTASSSERNTRIRLNGTTIIAGNSHKASNSDNEAVVSSVVTVYALALLDYLEVIVRNGDSGAQNVSSAAFSAVWLGRSS